MRKKSEAEKAQIGTMRLDKVRKARTIITHDLPKPQPYLTAGGKRIFKAICEHLIEHETLCKIDGVYISLVAHNIDLYNRMMAEIESKEKDRPQSGYFQTFANGTVQNSPHYNAANKAFDIIEKGCRNLGMTVKSRDAILAFAKKGEEEDDGDEFGLN